MHFKRNRLLQIAFTFLLVCCSACRPNGMERPDAPLCTVTHVSGECTDARGDFNIPHEGMMCTTLDGYLTLENYIDSLEKEVIRLRRRRK
jgi:hypothetical protein